MTRITPSVIKDDDAIDFARPLHERWVGLVQQGKIVSIPIPLGAGQSTRNAINGALRSRNVRATVKQGIDGSGSPVYIVRLREP